MEVASVGGIFQVCTLISEARFVIKDLFFALVLAKEMVPTTPHLPVLSRSMILGCTRQSSLLAIAFVRLVVSCMNGVSAVVSSCTPYHLTCNLHWVEFTQKIG